MTSLKGGQSSNYNYKLHKMQKKTESVGYFVLEHQPRSCDELPADGACHWTNITIHVNKKLVADAKWVAKQEKPKCGSKVVVHNSTALDITWTG